MLNSAINLRLFSCCPLFVCLTVHRRHGLTVQLMAAALIDDWSLADIGVAEQHQVDVSEPRGLDDGSQMEQPQEDGEAVIVQSNGRPLDGNLPLFVQLDSASDNKCFFNRQRLLRPQSNQITPHHKPPFHSSNSNNIHTYLHPAPPFYRPRYCNFICNTQLSLVKCNSCKLQYTPVSSHLCCCCESHGAGGTHE